MNCRMVIILLSVMSTVGMLRDLCARACYDVHLLELCADLLATSAYEAERVEDRERKEGNSSGHCATAPSGAQGGAIIVWRTF
eukprot:7422800-Pyramimonas_sp.AAC.1